MNNKEFIAELAQRLASTQKQTTALTNALARIISDNLREGNDVALGNLGNLCTKAKEQRIIVNPKTRNRMLVPPKIVAEFHPSRSLKEKCK